MTKDNKNNTGENNSGDWNSGHKNSGYGNSGDRNSGYGNSGYWNSGNRNSGNRNSGNWNSGDRNSGYGNSGNWNSGDRNSGYRNSGYRNSGNWNSGDRNSGYGNSTNRETGIFNTTQGKIRCFNQETDLSWDDIDHPEFNNFYLNKWIPEADMTDEEKKSDPEFYVRGGYLKTYTWEEAWANYWRDSDDEEKQKVLNLPNFDAVIFKEITGIDVEQPKTTNPPEITFDGATYVLKEAIKGNK
jgi:hypothetical protein